MIKTNIYRKIRCKYKNGLGKNGKETFKSVSLNRLGENVTKEQSIEVGKLIGKIIGKDLVSATNVMESEHHEEI
ncbi:DUF1659 domain-containing protein [Peptoniphilus lacrimalis]|jgi:hypothetical protein|uniref:DUF1659 domain-containing protein n=1 Tax=Peptoniphilus lacrimalis TaxID=33031 RepID=UPI0023F9A752|nr:hypothetical protein [Peptoniphilus lacrimalis]